MKVLAIVLLLFTHMNTEVTMATLSQSGAARTAARPVASGAARPAQQQQSQNVPAWLQGAYNQPAMAPQPQPTQPPMNKGARDQLANAGNKRTNALNPAREDRPAWMQAAQVVSDTAKLIPQLVAPGGVPAYLVNNYLSPYLASFLPANKSNDQFGPGSPNKDLNRLGRLSGRTMFGEGVGPGTLDPALWDQTGEGGFGSSYGGNWKGRGGGGGGGGNWGSGYNNADYPAWMKIAMGLNSWNIK